jgi:16S rRNA (guanine527-N7)-methyltransferase
VTEPGRISKPGSAEDVDPAAIEAFFGGNAANAQHYAELLVTDGILRGMIGPGEASRVWSRHLFNSAALAELLPESAVVIDLGSGAGLPGIPLALARPDLTMTLLEPMARRVRFLTDVLAALDLPNVAIEHSRAEAAQRRSAQVVVARAVAALPRLVELAFPLLDRDGMLLALKGVTAAAEAAELRAQGGWLSVVHALPAPGEVATVVEVRRAGQ